jgi:hypothetical protein
LVRLEGQAWHRVYIGPFGSEAAARESVLDAREVEPIVYFQIVAVASIPTSS